MKPIKTLITATALLLGSHAIANEVPQGMLSGEDYLQFAKDYPRLIESYTAGTFHAALTLGGLTCPPPEVTPAEASALAVKMIGARPDLQAYPITHLLLSAWGHQWPCSTKEIGNELKPRQP